jgi:hypothetical protein
MANDLNHDQLLAREPAQYFKDGLVDTSGKLRPELAGLDAFAVATQLLEGDASPDEVAATYEALRQLLAEATGDPGRAFAAAVQDALTLVSRLLGVRNNIVLAGWLRECRPYIKTAADMAAFLQFFEAVIRQYTSLVAVQSPPEEQAPAP